MSLKNQLAGWISRVVHVKVIDVPSNNPNSTDAHFVIQLQVDCFGPQNTAHIDMIESAIHLLDTAVKENALRQALCNCTWQLVKPDDHCIFGCNHPVASEADLAGWGYRRP